jgi:4-hydroxybenzoate polyprenyltransferase
VIVFHFQSWKKTIDKIENLRIFPPFIALYFSFLISLRDLFEQQFFEKSFSIFQFDHHFFFYVLMLLVGILVISSIGKIAVAKTTLIVAAGFIVIIFPPLVDHFIFFRNNPYDYVLPRDFLRNFSTFFLFTPRAGTGIFLEIIAILGLAGLYVFIKSKSPIRAISTSLVLYLLVGLSVAPRLFLPLPDTTKPPFWESRHIVYLSYNLALCLLAAIVFIWKINPALPKAAFQEICSFRTLNFMAMVCAGIYIRKILHFFIFPDFLYVLMSLVLMGILWTVTVLINNVYDLPIDQVTNLNRPLVHRQVSASSYLSLSFILAIVAFYISLVMGILCTFITCLSLLSAAAYSIPPLRIRKRLLSNLFIGWGSFLAFFLGYFIWTNITDIVITRDAIRLSLVIFLALSLGSFTKDLKDYEGDRRYGVRTFVTLYGIAKGKKIIVFFQFLSLLTPIIYFSKLRDMIFFIVLSSAVSLVFYSREKLAVSYLGYLLAFAYCVLRATGNI